MQFNPVVLSVEMPVCKIFVTKIQKTGRIWTNYGSPDNHWGYA